MGVSRGWLIVAALAGALAMPAAARAEPPTITSVTSDPGLIQIQWTLPAGMHSWVVETATSPETVASGDQAGSFLPQNVVFFVIHHANDLVGGAYGLPAGTYYIHVSAYGTCETPLAPACVKEYSETRSVTIPAVLPQLTSLQLVGRRIRATWSSPWWMKTDLIEIASAPDVQPGKTSEGPFPEANLMLKRPLTSDQQSFTSGPEFPGGTYYVHVAASEPAACGGRFPPSFCVEWYSSTISIVVPPNGPTLRSVGQSGGRITAAWSLQPGTLNSYIEVATSPDVYPDGPLRGAFLDAATVLLDDTLDPEQTEYTAPDQLPPGRYYVHVASYAPASCPTPAAPTCADEFSQTVSLTIPPDPGPPIVAKAPVDNSTAFAALKVRRRQTPRRLFVRARMLEAGSISVSATAALGNGSTFYELGTVTRKAAPGVTVKLRVKLPAIALRAVRQALSRHVRVTVRLSIEARDRAGNVVVRHRRVWLTA